MGDDYLEINSGQMSLILKQMWLSFKMHMNRRAHPMMVEQRLMMWAGNPKLTDSEMERKTDALSLLWP